MTFIADLTKNLQTPPNHGSRNENERGKTRRQFVVTSGYPAKLLESIEEPFDSVSDCVALCIVFVRVSALWMRWNHRSRPDRLDFFPESFRVVGSIGYDATGDDTLKQIVGGRTVMRLAPAKTEVYEIAECFSQRMEFGCKPAARAAKSLWSAFFWAPAAC